MSAAETTETPRRRMPRRSGMARLHIEIPRELATSTRILALQKNTSVSRLIEAELKRLLAKT